MRPSPALARMQLGKRYAGKVLGSTDMPDPKSLEADGELRELYPVFIQFCRVAPRRSIRLRYDQGRVSQ